MKPLIFALSAIALIACDAKPAEESRVVGPQGSYKVDRLFTVDGCTVYRFDDGGRSRYFTNCGGSAMSEHTESCGKGCTRHVDDSIYGGGY